MCISCACVHIVWASTHIYMCMGLSSYAHTCVCVHVCVVCTHVCACVIISPNTCAHTWLPASLLPLPCCQAGQPAPFSLMGLSPNQAAALTSVLPVFPPRWCPPTATCADRHWGLISLHKGLLHQLLLVWMVPLQVSDHNSSPGHGIWVGDTPTRG